MPTRALFVTQLYEASLADEPGFVPFNRELAQACAMLADEDAAGRAWSKAHGYRGYTSYASLDDLPTRASVFGALKRKLDRHAAAFAEALSLDLGRSRLRLDSLWVNVIAPGGAHSGHIHTHSTISGVLYVAMPKGAGGLRLEDPRLPLMMAAPTRRADAAEPLRTSIEIAPREGSLVMWESWLRHEALPNAARAARVSISFNYGWR
jgi:uncharacterized protein (TIGR02466 family)